MSDDQGEKCRQALLRLSPAWRVVTAADGVDLIEMERRYPGAVEARYRDGWPQARLTPTGVAMKREIAARGERFWIRIGTNIAEGLANGIGFSLSIVTVLWIGSKLVGRGLAP